ncbi:PEP-CTERM sorting domain-containing protein [Pseudodesulfovibrio karagichevae]|uniref:PEP-CTERM sorting domain-containing protein n=1 Tax=Pseudodesulfovibrio karagichevae TaxID=3239305 RepID=A0ABV4JY46_9BACT
MKKILLSLAICMLLIPNMANASVFTFDDDSQLSAWYPDRTAPDQFATTPDGRLAIGIAPPVPGLEFYQTKGQKTDINTPATGKMIIGDLFVDANWHDMRAGLWGTSSVGSVTGWPIISWHNLTDSYGFHVWDLNHWVAVGLDYTVQDAWYSLGMAITGSSIDYYINNSLVYSSSLFLPTTIDEIILNTKTSQPQEYTVLWDNVGVVDAPTPTPEPSTFLLLGVGIAGLLAVGKKKISKI